MEVLHTSLGGSTPPPGKYGVMAQRRLQQLCKLSLHNVGSSPTGSKVIIHVDASVMAARHAVDVLVLVRPQCIQICPRRRNRRTLNTSLWIQSYEVSHEP